MAFQEFSNLSTINLQALLDFPTLDFPIFYSIFLFVVFTVFTSLSYFMEVKRQGSGDILSSFAVSSFVTLAIAVILSYLQLISSTVLIFTMVVTFVFVVLFLLTNKN